MPRSYLEALSIIHNIHTTDPDRLPPNMTVHPFVYRDYVEPVVESQNKHLPRNYWGDEIVTRSQVFMKASRSWAEQGKVEHGTEMLEGDAAKQDWEEQYTTLQQCLTDPNNEVLPEKPAITLAQLHTTLRDDTLRALAMPLTDIKATALKVFIIKVNSFLDSYAGYSEMEIELQGLREKPHIGTATVLAFKGRQ